MKQIKLSKTDSVLKGKMRKHRKWKETTTNPDDTTPNTRLSNASDAKHMDTRPRTARELWYVADARKNTNQEPALQKSTNAHTAVMRTLPGTASAQEDLKNMKN